jgi:RNA-directed DNA polymerase
MDKVVLRKWLKAGFIDQGALFLTEAGTPQGGIASPVLANMALDGMEDAVRSALGRSRNARQPAKAHVVRYADDFVVTGATRELLRKLPQIENNMKIEASISLRRRDEEVKVHGEPDCCNLG